MTPIPPMQPSEKKSTFVRDASLITGATVLPAAVRYVQINPTVMEGDELCWRNSFVREVGKFNSVQRAAAVNVDWMVLGLENDPTKIKEFLVNAGYDADKVKGIDTLDKAKKFIKKENEIVEHFALRKIRRTNIITEEGKLAEKISRNDKPIANAFKRARLKSAGTWGAVGLGVMSAAVLAYNYFTGDDKTKPADPNKKQAEPSKPVS